MGKGILVAVDVGGTFTDVAAYDPATGRIRHAKSLTTYGDYIVGMDRCFKFIETSLSDCISFKHGTTLVINMLIQRAGARIALITTRGFKDVLEIGRGNRADPFKPDYRRDAPLIPRVMRFEIDERVDGRGEVLRSVDLKALPELARALAERGVEAVAVCFVNAYRHPAHEQAVAAKLRELLPDVFVSCSTDLTREWYEYERTATVAANAYVGPGVREYIKRLDVDLSERGYQGSKFFMGSGSGVLSPERAADAPIHLVESGPVGGLVGAAACAAAMLLPRIIALDVGGTTAKCAVVRDGRFDVHATYWIGGYTRGFPIRSSIVDIVEVGAGGGSIAYVDDQGRLHVGPKSAGSIPGPVAYGLGGTEPTVTDANLALGRIDAESLLGDGLKLNAGAARRAIRERLGSLLGYSEEADVPRLAAGVISIALITMAAAIRKITIERGEDPRDYALFAYGGGGPLHAVDLARELGIPLVVIPPNAGTFAALGMLFADIEIDETRTFLKPLSDDSLPDTDRTFQEIEIALERQLRREYPEGPAVLARQAEMRYHGQMHTVRVDLTGLRDAASIQKRFLEIYIKRYGHAHPGAIEFVALRSIARAATQKPVLQRAAIAPRELTARSRDVWFEGAGRWIDTLAHFLSDLHPGFRCDGPVLIEDYGSTCVVDANDRVEIGRFGEIRVEISPRSRT